MTPGPIYEMIHSDFFPLVFPLKVPSTENLIYARLSVSRTIYVNVESPNLGFRYFNVYKILYQGVHTIAYTFAAQWTLNIDHNY